MLLRFNQYFFASMVYAVKTSVVAALAFIAVMTIALFQFEGVFLFFASYVLLFSFISCFLVFNFSVLLQRRFKSRSLKWQSYFFTAMAGFLANLFLPLIGSFNLKDVSIFLIPATLITIFLGSKFYVSTWGKLNAVLLYPERSH